MFLSFYFYRDTSSFGAKAIKREIPDLFLH